MEFSRQLTLSPPFTKVSLSFFVSFGNIFLKTNESFAFKNMSEVQCLKLLTDISETVREDQTEVKAVLEIA